MDRVLVINAGSSSLKLSLLGGGGGAPLRDAATAPQLAVVSPWEERPLAERELASDGTGVDRAELRDTLERLDPADVVAHRIVHGGARFREAVVVDPEVRGALAELTSLAPLHQPKSLDALDAVTELLPDLPAVACFDTAFHATLPDAAATFALPRQWREQWQLRRYGFHGLSHAYIARWVAGRYGSQMKVISCHLGSGASLCAIANGRSVDTTMGFTPLDGLVMATRSGSVDPGLLLWLLEQTGLTEQEMATALEHDSGLKGLAGVADMRELLRRRADGDRYARLAIDVYLHRLRAGIASMAAALDGVDVIAFTGGVGEHSAEIRDEAMSGLGFLHPAPRVLTVPAREDLEMARQTRELMAAKQNPAFTQTH